MRIHRAGQDDGPGLLLIHGLSSSHRVWQRNLAALGQGHRLLIAELFSPGAGPRVRLADQARHLAEALAQEARPVAVIGHSLGGLVALELATSRPELVDRLVLVDVPAMPSVAPLSRRLATLAQPGSLADARSVGVVALTLLSGNPLQLLDATAVSVRSDLGATAADIRIPTLVVWGEQDSLVPVEVGRRLTGLIPGARLRVLPGTGHQPQWEAPDAFHSAVQAFLAEV